MYRSKKSVQKKSLSALKKDFLIFLKDHSKVFCSALSRPVFTGKQPEATLKRKDAKFRLEAFAPTIDILKHAKEVTFRKAKKTIEYAIQGHSKEGYLVTMHLREEMDTKKNRKIFLISFFYK